MHNKEMYRIAKELFEQKYSERTGKKVSLINILHILPEDVNPLGRTVMEGEKSVVYRLPLHIALADEGSTREEVEYRDEMWVLKIYDSDRIDPKLVRCEAEISRLIHGQRPELTPLVLGHKNQEDKSYLFIQYAGPKTVGKFYVGMSPEEMEVLAKVKNGKLRTGDEDVVAWLEFMGFISPQGNSYRWEPSTEERFRINRNNRIVELDEFYDNNLRALKGAIDVKHDVELVMNQPKNKKTIEEIISEGNPSTAEQYTQAFFDRFQFVPVFCGLEEEYQDDKSQLELLFSETISQRKEAENQNNRLTLGNAYLMNFIQDLGQPNGQNGSSVRVIDLYHITQGHWIVGDVDIIGVASAQHGLKQGDRRALWYYAWSRAASDFKTRQMPLDLKTLYTFERLGFFVSTACRQLTAGASKLTLGSRRQRLRTIRDKSNFLLEYLKKHQEGSRHYEAIRSQIDSQTMIRTDLFNPEFVSLFSKYLEKINSKSLELLLKKGCQ